MARLSKAHRVNTILAANPLLKRDDPRIDELLNAEVQLRKAQRAANNAPVTVASRNGIKRSPELVAVDHSNAMVRRLRNELGIDRLSVKRSESNGVKVKRSPEADKLIEQFGPDYHIHKELIPTLAAFLTAKGITAEDLPEAHQASFKVDLEAQAQHVEGIRDRIRK